MCRIKELSQKYSGNVKFFLVDVLLLKKKKKEKFRKILILPVKIG